VPARVLRAWEHGRFELVVSEHLVSELAGVLARPKFADSITGADVDRVLELLRKATLLPDRPASARLTEDTDDDYLAALAETSGAAFLVTGDRALGRRTSSTVAVVTPRDFLEQLG